MLAQTHRFLFSGTFCFDFAFEDGSLRYGCLQLAADFLQLLLCPLQLIVPTLELLLELLKVLLMTKITLRCGMLISFLQVGKGRREQTAEPLLRFNAPPCGFYSPWLPAQALLPEPRLPLLVVANGSAPRWPRLFPSPSCTPLPPYPPSGDPRHRTCPTENSQKDSQTSICGDQYWQDSVTHQMSIVLLLELLEVLFASLSLFLGRSPCRYLLFSLLI